MTNKVLFVLTSHDKMGNTGNKTGYWKEEFATPYYALIDGGVDITLATPKGGIAPVDPNSEAEDYASDSTRRLDDDLATQDALNNTLRLDVVNPSQFAAVFYPGGHGPMWDLADDETSIRLIETFHASNKPIATVCHGSIALKNPKDSTGKPLVSGKIVTGFTNSEEAAMGLTDIVPELVQDALTKAGASFNDGGDFVSNAVSDGLIITGQNPMSSERVAKLLLAALK